MPPGAGPGGLPLPPHGPPPPLTPTKSQEGGGGGSPGGVSPPTSSSALPPPTAAAAAAAYPAHFSSGSLIQLSSGDLKPIEDLDAEDFLHCAKSNPEVQIDQSVVIDIVFRGEAGPNTPADDDSGKKDSTGGGTGDISDVAILKLVVGRHKIHVSTFSGDGKLF